MDNGVRGFCGHFVQLRVRLELVHDYVTVITLYLRSMDLIVPEASRKQITVTQEFIVLVCI